MLSTVLWIVIPIYLFGLVATASYNASVEYPPPPAIRSLTIGLLWPFLLVRGVWREAIKIVMEK